MRSIPLAIIKTYRLIPAEKRSLWSFGTSSSHLALASPSWTSLLHYGTPRFSLGKIDPGWDSPQPPYPGGKLSMAGPSMGWDTNPPTPSPFKLLKSFTGGWFKLFFLLPLMLLGMNVGGNWETTPPQR